MSAIDTVLQQPAAQAVGWALLHFLWQGALIGVLTALALAALRRSAADVRYVVATIGLSLMLTMPIVTAVQVWSAAEASRVRVAAGQGDSATPPAVVAAEVRSTMNVAPPAASAVPVPGAPAASLASRIRVEPWLPMLVLAWFAGVAVLTLRLLSGWLWVQRMKSHGAVAAGDGLQAMALRLARRLHIRRNVVLLESRRVDVPTVIGWMKPVVLLPASALAGLAPQQLEAILAHELAHIRRHDYLVNLTQALVETLLFYHPAVWWISRRIRIEREHCCDDLAVSLCGDPYTYATALADLEELRGAAGASRLEKGAHLAMAATGGSLLQRVRRLLGAPSHAGREPGWLAGSAAIFVMLGIAAGAVGSDTAQAPAAAPAIESAAVPAPVLPPLDEPRARAAAERDRPLSRASGDAARDASDALAAFTRALADAAPPGFNLGAAFQAPPVPPIPPVPSAAPVPPMPPAEPGLLDAAMPPTPGMPPPPPAMAPMPPMSPMTPAPPMPPAPPMLPAQAISGSRGQSSGNYTWSHNGERLEIKYSGDIEFSDDDADVARLSPGGYFRISDGGWFGGNSVEFRADARGNITRRYWAGASERPFDPEGRAWLSKTLPRFVRQSGIGAPARVARILEAKGPAGVLAEISLIEGGWAKRIYFQELLKAASLDAPTTVRMLEQAGREMQSDYELASLLISGADRLLVDGATRKAYFDSARTIQSDYEMRRVYASALKKGPVSPALLQGILDASHEIESDYEAASLLIQIAKLQPLESTTRAPFFRAVDGVDSSYERARVLQAVVRQPGVSQETVLDVLRAARGISSDYERSQVLLATANAVTLTGEARDQYVDAATTLGDYEQGRALTALVRSERRRE